MKCMPVNFSGLPVTWASRVMEIEEVFDAKMVPAGHILSSSLKICFFASSFSTTASITKPASLQSFRLAVVFILDRILSLSLLSSFPSPTLFSSLSFIFSNPALACYSFVDARITSYPLWAATWAMPPPIVPAPITAIFFMSMLNPSTIFVFYPSKLFFPNREP